MIRTAFSTVACPEWTLERVARTASELGFDGVELRTFGNASTEFACDPALTSAAKVRGLFGDLGVRVASLATGVRFDERILPRVIGRVISDTEVSVRAGKAAVDLAAQIEAPFVRVFGFEVSPKESRKVVTARILERLAMVLDGAHNTGERVLLENGGSFARASDLIELIDRAKSPLLGASYSSAVAHAAGECPVEGSKLLGNRLWVARVKDYQHGKPCALGAGDEPCEEFVAALGDCWLVYEWDRAWLEGLEPAEVVLPGAAKKMYEWIASRSAWQQVVSAG